MNKRRIPETQPHAEDLKVNGGVMAVSKQTSRSRFLRRIRALRRAPQDREGLVTRASHEEIH